MKLDRHNDPWKIHLSTPRGELLEPICHEYWQNSWLREYRDSKTTVDIRRKFGFFTAEVRLLGLFLLFSHKLRSKAKFC